LADIEDTIINQLTTYSTVQKFWANMGFWKKSLPRLHFFDQKYSRNSNIITIQNNCFLF